MVRRPLHDNKRRSAVMRAQQAAILLARRFDIECNDPVVLHHSQHISIRLLPSPVVARVKILDQPSAARQLRRELAIARHLVEKAAPVVAPTTEFPSGPHFESGLGVTLWQFVEHIAADFDDAEHVAHASKALKAVHDALVDFPGRLPSLASRTDACRNLLQDEAMLPVISQADRTFLRNVYEHVDATLRELPLRQVPIHGDAGAYNVLITSHGARYGDFESVCLGPREWDIGFLPDIDLSPFEPINRDALTVLADMRSLCVSVWCLAKHDLPGKREAAEYHLEYLRQRFP